jgi:hypothetical protein
MKRWLLLMSSFSVAALALVAQSTRAQVTQPRPADVGPGEGGATLRLPGDAAPTPTPNSAVPDAMKGLWKGQPNPFGSATASRIAQLPSNSIEINKDVEITDKQSPWVIFVMAYSGPEAPKLARDFVVELRQNWKLNAFVYNYGADEKRKEYERVEKAKRDQLDALQKAGLTGKYLPSPVRAVSIPEQTGVLIDGGYRSRDQALEALKTLRKTSDERIKTDKAFVDRVKLDVKVAMVEEKDKTAKGGIRIGQAEAVFINPFVRAFPARNPAIPEHHAAAQLDENDLKLMRTLNEGEPFSLMKCKKAYTLVIKQYNTQQVIIRNKQEEAGFLKRFPVVFDLSKKEEDISANYAHNLAEAFRKSGLAETFVLHAKYSSFVTVGGYDGLEDPRMKQMQDFLEDRFQMNEYRPIGLLARPAPMAVPR